MSATPPRLPVPLWIAAAFGLLFTAAGIWQTCLMFGPPLLLATGIASLILTAIAALYARAAAR